MAHPIELLAERTRKDVAEELGLPYHQVAQAEVRALKKIREQYPWLAEYLDDLPEPHNKRIEL